MAKFFQSRRRVFVVALLLATVLLVIISTSSLVNDARFRMIPVEMDSKSTLTASPNSVQAITDSRAVVPEDIPENSHGEDSAPDGLVIKYNEDGSKVTRPWDSDQECSRFTVRLGKDIPQILLLSYPRSGGNWLRYLLEGATGVFTGSTNMDPRLPKLGFLGDSENPSSGTALLIRETVYLRQTIGADIPVVLIIRNPRDAIASYQSYLAGSSSFTYKGTVDDFKQPGFDVGRMLQEWEKVVTNRILESRRLHVVLYENLKENTVHEVERLLIFLTVAEDPERLECLANHLEGPLKRAQAKLYTYSKDEEALIGEAVERASSLLVERGFPSLPY